MVQLSALCVEDDDDGGNGDNGGVDGVTLKLCRKMCHTFV
jgi:hypothetical protein